MLLLTIRIATLIVTVGFLASELFPRWLVRAFTDDPDLTAMAVHGMRLGYCLLFLDGFQIVVSVFLQSISKAQKAVFMGLSRQVIFLIPALYFFSRWFGLTPECGYRSRPPTCWRPLWRFCSCAAKDAYFIPLPADGYDCCTFENP